ncbi:glycosyltransferase family 9 protein [Halobacteriovorax sp. HLS]|uniref:glycosyltransferase family 9 protein n=1 Tax=Halobacteriovorax sp. HLS TaxID=2234000 RepID=UPI000FD7FDFC|nr:glycosyltransferase family 9 protein [Halobacteriovorax sp. HLS]
MSAVKNSTDIEVPPQEVKKTIALVQILRLGDIIQTVQMAQGLRYVHGEKYRLLLIARKQFATPLKKIIDSVFDECITVDLNDLTLSSQTTNLENTLTNIEALRSKINLNNIEVCINLSYSKSANYLMSLINAQHKIGPHYDTNANIVINDKWSQYLYANVLETNQNPYSLVDLFNFIVGVDLTSTTKNKVKNSVKKKLIIHPFASDPKKKWSESKWVEIIFKFLKDNTDKAVHIVGAKSDLECCDKIIKNPLLKDYLDRIHVDCAKLSINELKESMDSDTCFIGHDSMVSHLASLQQIPIITVSIGPVRPHETTPYIEGVYNLSPQTKCFPCKPDTKCDFYQCHADIPFQTINEVLNLVANGKEVTEEALKEKLSHFHLNSINIRKSEFNESGVYILKSITKDESNYLDTTASFYRLAWAYLFNGIEVKQDLPIISDKTHQQIMTDMKGLHQFYELCEFGKKYSRYILEEISSKTPDIQKIKSFSNKVDEVDKLSDLIAQTYPQLTPVTNFAKISKANLHGDNLVKLTESSFYAFNDLSNLCSIIYDLCEKTLTSKQKEKTNLSTINPR